MRQLEQTGGQHHRVGQALLALLVSRLLGVHWDHINHLLVVQDVDENLLARVNVASLDHEADIGRDDSGGHSSGSNRSGMDHRLRGSSRRGRSSMSNGSCRGNCGYGSHRLDLNGLLHNRLRSRNRGRGSYYRLRVLYWRMNGLLSRRRGFISGSHRGRGLGSGFMMHRSHRRRRSVWSRNWFYFFSRLWFNNGDRRYNCMILNSFGGLRN